jgi:hypothetical protein
MTLVDPFEATDVPIALMAVTVKVYEVPLVRPGTITHVPPVVVAVTPPGLAVTV